MSAHKIWNDLLAVAKKDGKVTDEEQKLLDRIEKNLKEFDDKNNNLSEDEYRKKFAVHLEYVIDNAYASAQDDDIISWDEFAILKALKAKAREMQ
ncbi:MAG: hypothetical protein INQ03_11350 [Candidatus Heimdallarchaeota archaeon]|nr:hypothetical protein [Candidatus Heimdallarchaeota archaeon]